MGVSLRIDPEILFDNASLSGTSLDKIIGYLPADESAVFFKARSDKELVQLLDVMSEDYSLYGREASALSNLRKQLLRKSIGKNGAGASLSISQKKFLQGRSFETVEVCLILEIVRRLGFS